MTREQVDRAVQAIEWISYAMLIIAVVLFASLILTIVLLGIEVD